MHPPPDATRHYIDGQWRRGHGTRTQPIVDPDDRSVIGEVALGEAADVEAAVSAASAAFDAWAATPVATRAAVLARANELLVARNEEIAAAITLEMGAPVGLSRTLQAPSGTQHFSEVLRLLGSYAFEQPMGTTLLRREPVGVCALITPWNWPMNQMATKVAPALAAGCTVVLKPSELAPLSAALLAQVLHDAGLPPGVFNLVQGDGPGVGAALSSHPRVDMVSFTGSNRGGLAVANAAAPTVKRVALELGGKSACILLPDAPFDVAVPAAVRSCMLNSGQSCDARSRLLVPARDYERAKALAAAAADALTVGHPKDDPFMGPVANEAQYQRVVAAIRAGVADGADLVAGGAAPPAGLAGGCFVRPTVFARVEQGMAIAREEVFGPVLVVQAYDDVEHAIALANDSDYGLSGGVWSADRAAALAVARRLRTGMVHINDAGLDTRAPFGGYRRSGNGREWGVFGLEEFLEAKSVYGGA